MFCRASALRTCSTTSQLYVNASACPAPSGRRKKSDSRSWRRSRSLEPDAKRRAWLTRRAVLFYVPKGGLEPPRACAHWLLKPARLPVPPLRRIELRKIETGYSEVNVTNVGAEMI